MNAQYPKLWILYWKKIESFYLKICILESIEISNYIRYINTPFFFKQFKFWIVNFSIDDILDLYINITFCMQNLKFKDKILEYFHFYQYNLVDKKNWIQCNQFFVSEYHSILLVIYSKMILISLTNAFVWYFTAFLYFLSDVIFEI